MKKLNKTLIITSLICLVPLFVGIMLYSKLPNEIPTHWNFAGEIDGYSSKAIAVFVIPLGMLGLNLITHFALNNDPKINNASKAIVLLGKWTVPFVSSFFITISILYGLGYKLPVEKITPVFVGILFIIIGNYLPKCKQNYTTGIKLPWTLNSEENWNRTHRLGGYVWIIGGILMLVFTAIGWSAVIFVTLILLQVLIPIIYSFSLYKKGI